MGELLVQGIGWVAALVNHAVAKNTNIVVSSSRGGPLTSTSCSTSFLAALRGVSPAPMPAVASSRSRPRPSPQAALPSPRASRTPTRTRSSPSSEPGRARPAAPGLRRRLTSASSRSSPPIKAPRRGKSGRRVPASLGTSGRSRFMLDGSKILAAARRHSLAVEGAAAVGALLWRCALRALARLGAPTRASVHSPQVGLRRHLDPPAAHHAFGNHCVMLGATATAEEVSKVVGGDASASGALEKELRRAEKKLGGAIVRWLQGPEGHAVVYQLVGEAMLTRGSKGKGREASISDGKQRKKKKKKRKKRQKKKKKKKEMK